MKEIEGLVCLETGAVTLSAPFGMIMQLNTAKIIDGFCAFTISSSQLALLSNSLNYEHYEQKEKNKDTDIEF